jgi:threonine aldolase
VGVSQAFIAQARRVRKLLGGGMRQAGILAAAGILALTEMVDRLAEDHTYARRLAEGLAHVPGLDVRPQDVETNFVFFAVLDAAGQPTDTAAFTLAAATDGVLLSGGDDGRVRAVTHYGISAGDIDRAIAVLARVARGLAPARA